MNKPAIPIEIAAFDKVGIYSLLPPLLLPFPPGDLYKSRISKPYLEIFFYLDLWYLTTFNFLASYFFLNFAYLSLNYSILSGLAL